MNVTVGIKVLKVMNYELFLTRRVIQTVHTSEIKACNSYYQAIGFVLLRLGYEF